MASKKKTLLFDLDGIVTDLTGEILRRINAIYGTEYKNSDINVWEFHKKGSPVFHKEEHRLMAEEIFIRPELTRNLPFIDGSVDALKRLQSTQKYEMAFVSAPYDSNPTWVYDRTLWFKETKINKIVPHLIFTHSKSMVDRRYSY